MITGVATGIITSVNADTYVVPRIPMSSGRLSI